MSGKKFKKAIAAYEPTKKYTVEEACAIIGKIRISSKFDETVDASIRLGVNPKYADQMVRGSVVMPAGTGKTKRSKQARTSRARTSTSRRSPRRTGSTSTPSSPRRT